MFKRCQSCGEELHIIRNIKGEEHWEGCDYGCPSKQKVVEEAKKAIKENTNLRK